jgi:serine/threonine-protein kinase
MFCGRRHQTAAAEGGPDPTSRHSALTDIHRLEASGCYFRRVVRYQPIQVGAQIAGYQVEREIGRGGVGIVYLAKDLWLGRAVALKVLAPTLSSNDAFRRRFIHESRVAAAIDHPHIVPIFGAGEDNGVLYIAMRYVPGPDLGALLDRDGPLPVMGAMRIAAQVASALDAAHEHRLVHGDVKPGNILLARSDVGDDPHFAYLTDFGLTKPSLDASSATVDEFVGTVDYVSPEQISGHPLRAAVRPRTRSGVPGAATRGRCRIRAALRCRGGCG